MSSFFSGYPQEEITFGGFTGKSPMFCRDIGLMGAVFTADLKVIEEMLPLGYRPIRISPRRGLVAIHCIEYRDSDVGPYNEVALSLMIHPGGGGLPGPVRVAMCNALDSYHTFVQELPVNTEISVQGGRMVFNYPKYLANIVFTETSSHRTCTVKNVRTQALILEMTCARLKTHARHKLITINSYPIIGGESYRAKMLVNLQEFGVAHLRRRASIQPGDDEHARSFTRLALGRPLQYSYAPSGEAILTPPIPAGKNRN